MICGDTLCQISGNVMLLSLSRVTGKFDLVECLSLDANILTFAVNLSPVKTQQKFDNVCSIGVRQAQISNCLCSERKCTVILQVLTKRFTGHIQLATYM